MIEMFNIFVCENVELSDFLVDLIYIKNHCYNLRFNTLNKMFNIFNKVKTKQQMQRTYGISCYVCIHVFKVIYNLGSISLSGIHTPSCFFTFFVADDLLGLASSITSVAKTSISSSLLFITVAINQKELKLHKIHCNE